MARRVIFVTGGGRGIGRAVCQRFAAAGDATMAIARNQDELAETRRLIESAGGQCHTLTADVSSAGDVDRAIRETVERFGGIDVLVNNAGLAPNSTVAGMPLETYRDCNSVNIDAVFLTCKAVWDVMKRQGGGAIINVASVAAIDPFPGFATYGASKAWVVAFTRGLAEEGRPDNIRVYGIGPGAVDTQMLRGPFPDFPVSQCLQPEDVAETIFHLAAPACRYATGQTVFVKK